MEKISCIYRIVCLVTKKCYIGQTFYFERRKREHLNELRKGTHWNTHLQAAFNKYGKENFVFEILEYVELPENFEENKHAYKDFLCSYEQKWINYYNSANSEFGYNNSPSSGTRRGSKTSLETRQKQSEARKGKPKSEEHRRKISEGNKNKIISPETRKKQSDAHKDKPGFPGFKGKTHTPETRKKQSEAHKGKPGTFKGRHHTQEARQKIGNAARNRKQSQEQVYKRVRARKLTIESKQYIICTNCNNKKDRLVLPFAS